MNIETLLTLLFLILIFGVFIKLYFKNLNWFLNKEKEIEKLIKRELSGEIGYILNIYKPDSKDKNPISKNTTKAEIYLMENIEATYYRIVLFRKENKKFEIWTKIENSVFSKPKIKFSEPKEKLINL
jgi:hypothetical protein